MVQVMCEEMASSPAHHDLHVSLGVWHGSDSRPHFDPTLAWVREQIVNEVPQQLNVNEIWSHFVASNDLLYCVAKVQEDIIE